MANVDFIIRLRDRLTTTAAKMQSTLNRVTASAERTANAIDGIGLLAGGAAIAGLFKLGAELEQTTLFFNTLTGSVERGTKLFNELTEFANTTPFSNAAINKNAQTLLSFGVSADVVTQRLKTLGDVAGGDQNRLSSLALAFGQVQSAGRLTGQDLLQFINVGFNPLQIIAEKTGKTMGFLREEMSKGRITANQVTKAFEVATSAGGRFNNLTVKMSQTLAGRWSTAIGKARFLASEFGLSLKDIFSPFIDGLISVIGFISKYRETFFPLLKAGVIFTGIVIGLVAALKAWVAIQSVLNVLLTLNPIGLIIVATGALIALIVTLYQENETFRNVLQKTWNATKALASAFKSLLKPAFDFMITAFKTARDSIRHLIYQFNLLKDASFDFASTIQSVLSSAIQAILLPIQTLIKVFSDIFEIITKVSSVFKAVFAGDFAGAKSSIINLGNTMKDFVEKRLVIFLRGFQLYGEAIDSLKSGEFADAAKKIAQGIKQVTFAPFGVNAEETAKQANDLAQTFIENYKLGVEKAGGITLPNTQPVSGISGFGNQVKNLQQEGVVSGGIRTFNINIGTLTGIETLTTSNIGDGAGKAGQSVIDALLDALSDIRDIQP